MKLTNRMLIGAALVALPALAFALPVQLTNPSATFSNTIPSAGQNVTYSGSTDQEVRWGVPYQQTPPTQQSGLRFDVFGSPLNVNTGDTFDLGTLTHFNFPIGIPTVTSTDLSFSFLTLGVASNFTFNLGIEETPNTPPCAYPSVTPCADRISFPTMTSPQTFTIDGVDYTLTLLGFGTVESGGFEPSTSFISQEGGTNSIELWATITAATPPTNVPEPNALLIMALGLLALGGFVQYRRKQNYKA